MTTETKSKETLGFQAEVTQILKLMINSLYSNKEVFLRELISNASDACDKLRFEAIKDDKIYQGDSDLHIRVSFDEEAKTVTISDNGIGMNRDEVIANIGTIAKSGTKEFLANLTGDSAKDSQLIGQFGVGFYSSFIVADKVTLKTRRAGEDASKGVLWESEGEGEFSIEEISKETRGTEVILHLRDDEDIFLDQYKLQNVVKKFSDHISIPVKMKLKEPKFNDDGKHVGDDEIDKTVNEASALWTRPKSKIKEEEYTEFYRSVAHDFQEPLARIHNKLEGNLEYTLLLFVPGKAPMDFWTQEHKQGIKLYVKRVFIMDDAEKILPKYLRFVRGVVDSNDLPLNVSREILQENQIIATIRKTAVKKVLDLLEDLAKNDKEKFQTFWNEFGRVFKEGIVEDAANKERIASICRFSSTFDDKEEQLISLDDYVFRMKAEQKEIYYFIADSFSAAKNSPLLEGFRKKEIEVLLLSDRVDHWFVTNLEEYKGKILRSVSNSEIDLDDLSGDKKKDDEKKEEVSEAHQALLDRIKKSLETTVQDVKVSKRLTNSPVCLVSQKGDMDPNFKRMMEQMGQALPDMKPILEINPDHAILKRLDAEKDEALFKEWSEVLFDQAVLADGGKLEDPAGFVAKMNALIVNLSA